jgi:hypothetical protein
MKAWVTLVRQPDSTQLKAGEYTQILKKHLYGDELWCHWRCPTCSAYLSIGKKYHIINYLGEVDPMVVCPKKCGFTSWVQLEDWLPEAMGKA